MSNQRAETKMGPGSYALTGAGVGAAGAGSTVGLMGLQQVWPSFQSPLQWGWWAAWHGGPHDRLPERQTPRMYLKYGVRVHP